MEDTSVDVRVYLTQPLQEKVVMKENGRRKDESYRVLLVDDDEKLLALARLA